MKSAYFGLKISNGVFLLLDINPQNCDFFLNVFDFLGIFLILLLKFPKQMIGFLLQILNHQLLLLLSINDKVILSIRFRCIRDVVIVICHGVELKIHLLDILLQKQHHIFDSLLSTSFLFEHCQTYFYWHVVGIVIGDEFQLISQHSQYLDLALLPLQDQLHLLPHLFSRSTPRNILFM